MASAPRPTSTISDLSTTTLHTPDARGQAPRLPPGKHNEDSHPKRTQVATENLSQDFPGIFSNTMLIFFPGFLVGETPHISVRFTSCLFPLQLLYNHAHTIAIEKPWIQQPWFMQIVIVMDSRHHPLTHHSVCCNRRCFKESSTRTNWQGLCLY